jgi:hypothetical protein
MPPRTVSLSQELWILIGAAQGVRLLSERATQCPHGSVVQLCAEVAAVLAVIEGRLVMLERAVSGEVDPALIWCASNAAPTGDDDVPDVQLVEWSAKHAVRKARAELRRAKRRLQHERRERRS